MQVTRDAIAEWPALRSPVPAQSCRQGQSQDGNTTVTKGCENPSQQPKRQVQAEQPDVAEHKLPAGGTQGGERTRRAEPSGRESTFARPTGDLSCLAKGRKSGSGIGESGR